MKNAYRIFISVLIINTFSIVASGQSMSLNGNWTLRNKQFISGAAYANALPEKMEITLTTDSLKIKRDYDNGSGGTYTIEELLRLDGAPTKTNRNGNIRQAIYEPKKDSGYFNIAITYRNTTTGKQTSADFTELWKYDETNKEIIIEKYSVNADGSKWSVKGIYANGAAVHQKSPVITPVDKEKKGQGIQFISQLNWQQLKAKAKKENKYIFLDAYATWCVPCKQMDKEVFALPAIGDAVAKGFIPVKLQMDKTPKDDSQVRSWYTAAEKMSKDYTITGYPSYLFFNPRGELVHKSVGKSTPDEFIRLLNNVKIPDQQFYTQLKRFKQGQLKPVALPPLIKQSKIMGDSAMSRQLLNTYRDQYLLKLPTDSLLTYDHLNFINDYSAELIHEEGSRSPFFKLFAEKEEQVDQQSGLKGMAGYHTSRIIVREEIEAKLYNCIPSVCPPDSLRIINQQPDWAAIEKTISTKYPKKDAALFILDGKYKYYLIKKDTVNKMKVFIEKMDKYGPFSEPQSVDNKMIWALLPHCTDTVILNKALGWMQQIINSEYYKYPVAMTYGNYAAILYQLGRKEEAITAMREQLKARGYTDDQRQSPYFRTKMDNFEKMQRGEKIDSTWSLGGFF